MTESRSPNRTDDSIVMSFGNVLEDKLMSRRVRRWIEAWIVVWCPWVLLLEMDTVTMEEMRDV